MDPTAYAFLGAGLGAGIALIGGGLGIGRLAGSACISQSPWAMGQPAGAQRGLVVAVLWTSPSKLRLRRDSVSPGPGDRHDGLVLSDSCVGGSTLPPVCRLGLLRRLLERRPLVSESLDPELAAPQGVSGLPPSS